MNIPVRNTRTGKSAVQRNEAPPDPRAGIERILAERNLALVAVHEDVKGPSGGHSSELAVSASQLLAVPSAPTASKLRPSSRTSGSGSETLTVECLAMSPHEQESASSPYGSQLRARRKAPSDVPVDPALPFMKF